MATTYLSRTFGTPTNASKFTYSAWVKRCNLDGTQILLYANGGNAQNFSNIMFNSSNSFFWHILHSNSEISKLRSNRRLRDNNGWYHLVFQYDSTQATAANRTKMYINGVEVTSYHTQTNSGQNSNYHMNTAVEHLIGAEKGNTGGSVGNYFDGLMSHVHFVDGTIYAPSTFGETDSSTGEWKIKTNPGISTANYGNNGFWILKDGNSVTDQSGNGNNWTVAGGTLSDYEDNPSHVFNTMDSKNKSSVVSVRRCGGTTVGTSNSSSGSARSNFNIPATGKWYFEYKIIPDNQGNTYPNSGIKYNAAKYYNPDHSNSDADIFVYGTYGSILLYVRNGTNITAGAPASSGDIFGFAIDQDNGAIYVHENGTYLSQGGNVGVPTSGSSKTGAVFTYTAGTYPDMCLVGKEFGNSETQWNFGNGIFFTTPVSSAGNNQSGVGIFEYDCPNGYTALSTKGLNL